MTKNKNKVPVLVLASLGVLGLAYTPAQEPKARPSREFITKVYARPTQEEYLRASERRKHEILKSIRNVRKEIRIKAESYQLDRNTRLTAYTATQKTSIHCTKLINKIWDILLVSPYRL